ncbi:hypothetical protein niasHS_010201 [Heterodera schachtii]|uniref:Uncharacterized protein n=1 Tax=Heterodera schachtii TaxID=97005 RepID=A0ABD2IZ04_HETSC
MLYPSVLSSSSFPMFVYLFLFFSCSCSISLSAISPPQNGISEEKRGFSLVRNPYSWMARLQQKRSIPVGLDDVSSTNDEQLPTNLLLDEPLSKRSFPAAPRRPQNPYSWMSFADADQSNMDWLITRLRPFSDLVSKRLNALGMGFRRPKSPYLWVMNRQMMDE